MIKENSNFLNVKITLAQENIISKKKEQKYLFALDHQKEKEDKITKIIQALDNMKTYIRISNKNTQVITWLKKIIKNPKKRNLAQELTVLKKRKIMIAQ